jgi:hypothetical protein
VSATFSTQSRIAAEVASLSVRAPASTGRRGAEQLHPLDVGLLAADVLGRPCRRRIRGPSSAQAVAVATPCWPAPVSAMIRGLPMRLASSACPSALLILCEPVWLRSSRLR